MYMIGAWLVFGEAAPAVVLTGVITVLLHFKTALHGWVDKFGESDLRGIMQFVIISMVVLPILPDETYDKYESLNPRNIWLMVVLIVGISLAGYFLYKFLGNKAGAILGGIFGGLISSTATTVSYSKMARRSESISKLAIFIIITASAVSLIRVMIEISVVAPQSFTQFIFPLAIELAIMIILAIIVFFKHGRQKTKMEEQRNPAELKSALIFAFLYAVISFISAYTLDRFGNRALYAVAVISGLTDLDAITLSTAKMTERKSIDPDLGWRLIMVAMMSNLVFKGGLAVTLGSGFLKKRIIILFAILIAAGLSIVFLW
jgi:uncharacterized membrane protein (DUF4010 family)